jgi:hypothetical protein
VFDDTHPDFGPQIAVWLESADGSTFIDTLMVTNAVAVHGIGNRPGAWDLRSGPRFPYGRRQMALPIWAHARGKLYPYVAMNDGLEDNLTTHEDTSSPEPYFCRPMLPTEVVDAVTCPSGQFRSAKGLLDATQPSSYYPPRADLYNLGAAACLPRPGYSGSCDPGDSAQYFALNDVDIVSAATPVYGVPYTGTWVIPADLPDGDYRLNLEVAKEFDTDAAHQHATDPNVDPFSEDYGQYGNVGQPSVLFRVPFTLDASVLQTSAETAGYAGYGDWTGETGVVFLPDATIASTPGSGEGRLAPMGSAGAESRVALSTGPCPSVDCATSAPPLAVSFTATPTPSGGGVVLSVLQSSEAGQPVLGYDTRYAIAALYDAVDPSAFAGWAAGPAIPTGTPGTTTTVQIDGLTPGTGYAVGVRANGVCGSSDPSYQRFVTPIAKYTQLSGCFIATAAFGSDVDPAVRALRGARDAATARSRLAAAFTDLYYRSSPPLAALIRRSPTARATLRTALRIFTR